MPSTSGILMLLTTLSLTVALPTCYPPVGTATSLLQAGGNAPCCEVNAFRSICGSNTPGKGNGGVSVNFTYVDEDAKFLGLADPAITSTTLLTREEPSQWLYVLKSPMKKVTMAYTLQSRDARTANVSIVEARSVTTVPINTDPAYTKDCTMQQIVSNTGTLPKIDIETNCARVCSGKTRNGSPDNCSEMRICSVPMRFHPGDPRADVTEFFVAVVSFDGKIIYHLNHLSKDDFPRADFLVRISASCLPGMVDDNIYMKGTWGVAGNPATGLYQVFAIDVEWSVFSINRHVMSATRIVLPPGA